MINFSQFRDFVELVEQSSETYPISDELYDALDVAREQLALHEKQARARARAHYFSVTDSQFLADYPNVDVYVEEWWEERFA